ncbi:lung adenoma susceptibility protein 2 [Aplochiton taeniatus]
MISVRDFHSPDSTVTSLLATSGHLRSSFHPNPPASISYGDRHYESATAALDAYIADFDRSLHDPETSTGQLTLQSTPVRPRNMVRNIDVLQEQLTDGELDFLTLPLHSHRGASRPPAADRLTLTTDEMLAIPCDGSLPVTRTSAFLCQSGTHAQGLSGDHVYLEGQNSWPSARPSPRLGSSTTAACVYHSAPTLPPRVLRPRGRPGGVSQRFEPLVRVPHHHHHHLPSQSTETHLGTDAMDAATHQHYPRWFTSQRSEMDFSGITSVPDLKYPAWLRECDVGSGAPPRDPSHRPRGGTHTLHPSPRPPSWLGRLEASYEEQHQRRGGTGVGSPSCTDDLLDAERSWDNPRAAGSCSPSSSSRKHPGPVEALKQMLFSLQAVEQEVTMGQSSPPLAEPLQQDSTPQKPKDEVEYEDFDTAPGGQSLKRALHHLGRLKSLVEEPRQRREERAQPEKDS